MGKLIIITALKKQKKTIFKAFIAYLIHLKFYLKIYYALKMVIRSPLKIFKRLRIGCKPNHLNMKLLIVLREY